MFASNFFYEQLFKLEEAFPKFEESYCQAQVITYPITINGKKRATLDLSPETDESQAREAVLQSDAVKSYLEGKQIKKFIFVKGRIINVVVA